MSMALEAVFPDPYKFEINFVLKRGKTEVESWLVRRGKYTDPMSSNGGGVVDIVAFALRVTFWSFSKKSPVILLDEPFRFVSRDLQIRAGNVMKKLSESLGIQFIMVTHNQDMIDSATNVLQVRQKLGVSELTTRVNG